MRCTDGMPVGEADGETMVSGTLVVAGCIRPNKAAGESGVSDSMESA